MASVAVYVSSGGPVSLVCVQAAAFVVCGALVRSGRDRLDDVFRMGDAGRLVVAGALWRVRRATCPMRRGPMAGGLDLRPASNEAYKKSRFLS